MTHYRIEVSNSDGDALRTDVGTATMSDTAAVIRDLLTNGRLRDGDEITIRVGGGVRPRDRVTGQLPIRRRADLRLEDHPLLHPHTSPADRTSLGYEGP